MRNIIKTIHTIPGKLYIPLWRATGLYKDYIIGFLFFNEQDNLWYPCGWDEGYEDPEVAGREFWEWWARLPAADQISFGRNIPTPGINLYFSNN